MFCLAPSGHRTPGLYVAFRDTYSDIVLSHFTNDCLLLAPKKMYFVLS